MTQNNEMPMYVAKEFLHLFERTIMSQKEVKSCFIFDFHGLGRKGAIIERIVQATKVEKIIFPGQKRYRFTDCFYGKNDGLGYRRTKDDAGGNMMGFWIDRGFDSSAPNQQWPKFVKYCQRFLPWLKNHSLKEIEYVDFADWLENEYRELVELGLTF